MKFSVVVPVYNVAPFLRECLDSLSASAAEAAGEAEVEVVCVDDGSTDGSAAVLDGYPADGCMELKVVHKANGGVSSARNRGLDAATGDWVLFVDADDFVRRSYFSDVAGLVSAAGGADLVGFGMVAFFGGGLDWSDDGRPPRDVGIDRAVAGELAGMSVYRFAYRRDLVRGLRFPGYAYGEDLVFAAEAFARARRCVVSSRKEYVYRYREGSATHADISAEKMKTVISAGVDVFRALAASGKAVGEGFRAGRGYVWLCEQPRTILRRIGEPGWDGVWEHWLDSMSAAAGMPFLSRGQRLAAGIAARTRSRAVVRIVCMLARRVWRRANLV